MYPFILHLLTPKDATGQVIPIIGYFLQNKVKKLAIARSFAIQAPVFGLEVIIGETRRCKTTNAGGQHLNEYRTLVYLTQHSSSSSTIDEAIDILYDCDEFYDPEVIWPEIPASTVNVRRAVVTLFHRCQCPEIPES